MTDMEKITDIKKLMEIALEVRRDIIKMVYTAQSGHMGGSLSATEILVSLFYYHMKHDPTNPNWEGRDRFILSKGHATPAYYSILSRMGYFPYEELLSFRKLGSRLQGHPCLMEGVCGVEAPAGPLGQGLSVAVGMGLAAKLDKKDTKMYVLMGDGEIQEGQVWEAAMAASHYKLDNIVAIVDNNDVQLDGHVSEMMNIHPIWEKFKAFGWHVLHIDGHDFGQVISALDVSKNVTGSPLVIIAKTVKGKGISFMEDKALWHGKPPKAEEYRQAMAELGVEV